MTSTGRAAMAAAGCLCPPGQELHCNSWRCPRMVNASAEENMTSTKDDTAEGDEIKDALLKMSDEGYIGWNLAQDVYKRLEPIIRARLAEVEQQRDYYKGRDDEGQVIQAELEARLAEVERERDEARLYLKAFCRACIEDEDARSAVGVHEANPTMGWYFRHEGEAENHQDRFVTGGQVRRAMEIVGFDKLTIEPATRTIADELQEHRARAEAAEQTVKRLTEALAPFAKIAHEISKNGGDYEGWKHPVHWDHLARARAALVKENPDPRQRESA